MKKIMVTMLALTMTLSVPMTSYAKNSNDKSKDIKVIEKVYKTNGKTVRTYSGNADKEKIVEAVKSMADEANGLEEQSASILSNSVERTYKNEGRAETDSNALVKQSIDLAANTHFADLEIEVTGGTHKGLWMDGDPVLADKIVLRQTYTGSGLGISISIPPGVGLQESGNSATWVSDGIEDEWLATTSYENFSCKTYAPGAFVKITVESGADVYIGGTVHKARVAETKSFEDIVHDYDF